MKYKCNGCSNESPPCLIQTVPVNINLDAIATQNFQCKTLEVFTCPCDAIDFKQNQLIIGAKCIGCNICKKLCNSNFNWELFTSISHPSKLLNSLKHLQLFLELASHENTLFFTEVAAVGYSRNKRIDIVRVEDTTITLIKVLPKLSKINFYLRSYFDIIEQYSKKYPNITFRVEVISCSTEKTKSILDEFENVSIYSLNNYYKR